MARAIAFDLLNSDPPIPLILLDRDPDALSRLTKYLGKSGIESVVGDASDMSLLGELMRQAGVAIGAASYTLNLNAVRAAVVEGSHWIDLGGNSSVVQRQMELSDSALNRDVALIPDAGLAPGLVNILGKALFEMMDITEELHFRVGGLPQFPKPPLFYGLVFSAEGLANEYHEPALVPTCEEGYNYSLVSLA